MIWIPGTRNITCKGKGREGEVHRNIIETGVIGVKGELKNKIIVETKSKCQRLEIGGV